MESHTGKSGGYEAGLNTASSISCLNVFSFNVVKKANGASTQTRVSGHRLLLKFHYFDEDHSYMFEW